MQLGTALDVIVDKNQPGKPPCDLLRQWLHVGTKLTPGCWPTMKKGQNLVFQANYNSKAAPLKRPLRWPN